MIQVGVAGWDYPDWSGWVYPARVGRAFDRLAYLARYVDVIEINSTFYRPVERRWSESWLRRVAPFHDFVFTAKAHQSWTHRTGADLAREVPATLAGLRPLQDAGRLGALLVQFPQSFRHGPAAIRRLESLLERLSGWPVMVEVRHASWEKEQAADWFRRTGTGWCVVDQPRIGRSTARALPRVSGSVGYLRLHGRNAADWFRAEAPRDARYDYLYSEEQLQGLAQVARVLAQSAERTFVIQNNHFRGQALVNALQMKRLLQHVPPPAPEELVAGYPLLASQVRVERHRLF